MAVDLLPLPVNRICHGCGERPEEQGLMVHSVLSWHQSCAPARPSLQLAAEALREAVSDCPNCGGTQRCAVCFWVGDRADRLEAEARR